jgi:pentatricopeptide repeat protein
VTYRIPVNGLGKASRLDIALELFQEMENEAHFRRVFSLVSMNTAHSAMDDLCKTGLLIEAWGCNLIVVTFNLLLQ